MTTIPGSGPMWWDREVDSTGLPIRADVRATAHTIWNAAAGKASTRLGDSWQAAELMESSVEQVSRYLNGREVPVFSREISRLLMRGFMFSLNRRSTVRCRLKLVGDCNDLDRLFQLSGGDEKMLLRLDMAKVRERMSEQGWRICNLRLEGFSWTKIAGILGISKANAKVCYARELEAIKVDLMLS